MTEPAAVVIMVAVSQQSPAAVRQPLITRREVRWLIVLLIWCMLIAGAATFPVAVALMPPFDGNSHTEVALQDDAVPKRWPSPPPHRNLWPAPGTWRETSELGFDYIQVRAPAQRDGGNDFLMEVWRSGFPLRVVEAREFWWDWDNPELKRVERDLHLRLLWPGLVLNPLMLSGLAFVAFVLPVVAFILGRRLARRAAGRCVFCGYPIGASPICTECGRDLATGRVAG